jgi:hypothetical protein
LCQNEKRNEKRLSIFHVLGICYWYINSTVYIVDHKSCIEVIILILGSLFEDRRYSILGLYEFEKKKKISTHTIKGKSLTTEGEGKKK